MKNIDIIKKVLLCAIFCLATIRANANTLYDEWKANLIKEGQKKLIKVQTQNSFNDAHGMSDQNQYLIVVDPDNTFPDGEFVRQVKGRGRGSAEEVTYLLDDQKVIAIDNELRLMNSVSEIKTYVLIVRYMPMEFKNELSDGTNISDFFSGQKTDLARAIAQPVTQTASEIVKGITSKALDATALPTIYCGFVNFRLFKNDAEAFSQWVYYPHNNNINFDDEYERMLTSGVQRNTWPTSDIQKVDNLIAVIKSINTEYSAVKRLFADLYEIDHPIQMEAALRGLTANALSGFDIGLRLHILKVLSAGVTPGDREVQIINLIKTVQGEKDANQLITGLRHINDKVIEPSGMTGWCLVKCLTNQTSDGLISENYKSLIKALINLCKKSTVFNEEAASLLRGDPEMADRTILYNYNSFWSKLASTVTTYPKPLMDRNTDYAEGCMLLTETELFFKYVLPNVPLTSQTLDPLEPILFVNQSDLGMLSGFDKSNMFISPAIILRYADEKAWNQTATDVSMAVIDAASLATGYGELKAGVMGLRKAWVLMDMANSGINLSLNATLATKDSTVRKILEAYNLLTGGVAISRMTTGGIKSVLQQVDVKNVLNEDKIRTFLNTFEAGGEAAIKNLTDDELNSLHGLVQRIKTEANVKGVSDLELQADRILEQIQVAKGWGDLLQSLKAKGLTRADELSQTVWSRLEDWDATELTKLNDDIPTLKGALNNKPELVEAWKVLDDVGYTALRKIPASLEKLSCLLKNPKLVQAGLDEGMVSRLIKGNRGQGAAALDDITKGLDDLVSSGAKFEDIGKLVGEFDKGGNFAKGARYIQRQITSNVDEFAGKRIKFEETFKVGESTRRIDVNVKVNDNSPITFYEFKSTSTIPPDNFAQQFINDLELDDVADLNQLKWYFDGNEVSSLTKSDFVDALVSSKNDLFNSKARRLFENYLDISFTSADDLIANLRSKNEWFESIFQVK